MNNIKRLLLTAIVAFVSLVASSTDYDFAVDGIYYKFISISNLTCEVVSGDSLYTGNVVVPSTTTYKGKTVKVTGIGKAAFSGCMELYSIKIPNSITSVGEWAFNGCRNLTSVDIPNGVTSIGDYTFRSCSNLTSATIPNSVKNIGREAFMACTSLTCLNIPNSVISIDNYAFCNCYSLNSLKIPSSVTSIGYCALSGLGIKYLEIGKGIKSLPYLYISSTPSYCLTLLEHCDSLKKIVIVDSNESLSVPTRSGYIYQKIGVELNALSALEELYIGRDLTTLNETSFYSRSINNKKLQRVEYGDSVTTEENVSGCTGLEEIVYGKNIGSIKTSNISQDNLTAIYVKATTPPIVSGTFTNKTYLNVKLYVPKESLASYQATDVWKDFWDIEGYDFPNGISTSTIDKKNNVDVIYNLKGQRQSRPKRGINIINGKKVLVK